MQIHTITQSLITITSNTTALAALLPGGLYYGDRLPSDSLKPYGRVWVDEIGRRSSTGIVSLVDYEVTLEIFVGEAVGTTGSILDTFQQYWSRINTLPALDADVADLVLVYPGESTIIEAEEEEFGKDVISGETTLLIRLREKQPELTV